MMTKWVDAHQHFWKFSPRKHVWIDKEMQQLRRDYLPSDLFPEFIRTGIDATIAVQACQTSAETAWLLKLADEHPFIAGVVGWAPIDRPDFGAHLDRLCEHPKFRGLRHVLQDEPDDHYMLWGAFNRGIALLKERGLVYDILIYERHLPIVLQFVDCHPNQKFVVNHLAKPRIAAAEPSSWSRYIRELAQRPHVKCKLSGLTTEAKWDSWTVDDLRPYFEIAIEAFGPNRILAGSDWPVCTLACSYLRWWQTLLTLLSGFADVERSAILGGNAIDTYLLKGLDS